MKNEYRPFNYILPNSMKVAYDKAKSWLMHHPILHFFMHNTYCRLRKNYASYSLLHFYLDKIKRIH